LGNNLWILYKEKKEECKTPPIKKSVGEFIAFMVGYIKK